MSERPSNPLELEEHGRVDRSAAVDRPVASVEKGRSAAILVGLLVFIASTLWTLTKSDRSPSDPAGGPIESTRFHAIRPNLPPALLQEPAELSTFSVAEGETIVDGPPVSKKPRSAAPSTKPSEPSKPSAKNAARSEPTPPTTPIVPAPPITERKSLVADDSGRPVVARVFDGPGGKPFALLPDGRVGMLDRIVDTAQPFKPAAADQIERALLSGPCQGFQVVRGKHYLVIYNGSESFARASLRLLESLYEGLILRFKKNGLDVHDAEFPLVAIIYRDESEFRKRREIAAEIQAYYEILTNRIYFFEHSERDREAPEVAALRKPQTVAHEGVHQILQNIGVQPRLAPWPIWLTEGLAEYCSTTGSSRGVWKRIGVVNPFHMATIHDLQERPAQPGGTGPRVARSGRRSIVEDLVVKTELTPTDYALSWALTHYLAERGEIFAAYLRTLGELKPSDVRTPQQQLEQFRKSFSTDPAKLDKKVRDHLDKLKYEKIPYYAVTFERVTPAGLMTRTGFVSQSPSVIREWLDDTTNRVPGSVSTWHMFAFPTREEAVLRLRGWVEGE